MTITDGLAANYGQASGGGIFNQGTLTLTDAVVTGNTNTTSFYSPATPAEAVSSTRAR